MLTNRPRSVTTITVVLLLWLAIIVALQCQVHATPLDPEFTGSGTRGNPVSAHSMLDFSCLAAVLPAVVLFTFLLLLLPYTTPSLLKYAFPIFPLFRPPRHTAQ